MSCINAKHPKDNLKKNLKTNQTMIQTIHMKQSKIHIPFHTLKLNHNSPYTYYNPHTTIQLHQHQNKTLTKTLVTQQHNNQLHTPMNT